MGGFVLSDLDETTTNPEGESGLLECGFIELVEALGVEGILEEFQGQGELQDLGIWRMWRVSDCR